MSHTDPLTEVANRRASRRSGRERFEHARRYDRPLSLAMIDIDYFKDANDAYGHQAGDAVLRCVAGVIRLSSRQSDVVARYGGEEFAVIAAGDAASARRCSSGRRSATPSFRRGPRRDCCRASR